LGPWFATQLLLIFKLKVARERDGIKLMEV